MSPLHFKKKGTKKVKSSPRDRKADQASVTTPVRGEKVCGGGRPGEKGCPRVNQRKRKKKKRSENFSSLGREEKKGKEKKAFLLQIKKGEKEGKKKKKKRKNGGGKVP